MDLVTVWFALVVLCWVLFFVLEGFDFGVGALSPLLGRDDHERSAALRTIGPFWDGNEVWFVAAIGVTFAAFPDWYAALLSGLFLPFVAVLVLLAGRGVALEFRGKHSAAAWRRRCDAWLAATSLGVVALLGALLTVFVRGLALGPGGEVHSSPGVGAGLLRTLEPLATWQALAGAVAAVTLAVLLGSTFLGLRTTGPLRRRARRVAVATASTGAAALAGAAGISALTGHGPAPLWVGGALVLLVVVAAAAAHREALAFVAGAAVVAAAVVAALTAGGEVVLASTLDPAWSLTRGSAAASSTALAVISWAGVVVLPGVVAYQAFSYWVLRQRVTSERVPT
ncbi:cytochrome d ubiquinol oxidase subunit II [Cellulomonas endophytica]|uniref:cytochrome d ubiquinol oxidase subunit II n=1 Tax=Cellulomonas endophytica TaxID=2494735 RepID=UPI0010134B75|nr:cytochrome d ubiquinol oxidase subunit II [Cellulomonas endophytica]